MEGMGGEGHAISLASLGFLVFCPDPGLPLDKAGSLIRE